MADFSDNQLLSIPLPKSFHEDNIKHNVLPLQTHGKPIYIGGTSNKGWHMTLEETSEITLLNINTGVKIQLPEISEQNSFTRSKVQNEIVHKAVLSSQPDIDADNWIAMVIYGDSKELAYYKAGGETWTLLREAGTMYDDVVFHEGKFFAADEYGKVVSCEMKSSHTVTLVTERWFFWGQKLYIATMEERIFLVVRCIADRSDFARKTRDFKVCMLVHKHKGKSIGHLKNWVILAGRYHCVALPHYSINGLKENCIYFKDDYLHNLKGSVLRDEDGFRCFSLKDDTIDELQDPPYALLYAWQRNIVC
ncbi:hypothetical protein K2173_027766 [Erythroxylum novogranatense]|uniref:KIB1-4 beta-propeller domain-containing protein n=1 Tax=Erythroxylum novogranatense TaxID=1862640 RepID=A0AAV8U380_9ROSI|nr:hypothetical protein K2173_027766 [Erythroxylum novogranatense]